MRHRADLPFETINRGSLWRWPEGQGGAQVSLREEGRAGRLGFPVHQRWETDPRQRHSLPVHQASHQETRVGLRELEKPANFPRDVAETQRRKDIDLKYNVRSSRLTRVLGTLLCEGRLTKEELHALRGDKEKAIRSCARAV